MKDALRVECLAVVAEVEAKCVNGVDYKIVPNCLFFVVVVVFFIFFSFFVFFISYNPRIKAAFVKLAAAFIGNFASICGV